MYLYNAKTDEQGARELKQTLYVHILLAVKTESQKHMTEPYKKTFDYLSP